MSELTLEKVQAMADLFRWPPLPRTLIVPPLEDMEREVVEAIDWVKSEGVEVFESKFIRPDMTYWID